jgi:predicted O-linked N-acetylglucosamine transferase (SPINDLY family)
MNIVAAFQRALQMHQQGKLREAFHAYLAILAEAPDHAPSLHFSGVAALQVGDHRTAVERIRKAIEIDPAPAEPWANLALALSAGGAPEAAVNALKEATLRAPGDAGIWSNLAASELELGRHADAERSARQAIAAAPAHAEAWYNLALILEPQGRVLEALEAATRAAQLAPSGIAVAAFKAHLQGAAGQAKAARKTLEAAIAHKPGMAVLHRQLALLLQSQGDPVAAAREFERALKLGPEDGAVLSHLLELRKRMGDWRGMAELQARFRDGVSRNQALLTPLLFLGEPSSRMEQRRCATNWSAQFATLPPGAPKRALSSGRLKIGYLSADFHQHPTALLMAGLFGLHDRAKFEVYGYSTGIDDGSALRARLKAGFDHFVDVRGQRADVLAARIREDGIDILVDLKGHTDGALTQAMALRPAPIQVQYLGYPGTMGADFIDYVIGDAVVTPFADELDYAETIVQLPHSYQVNDRARVIGMAPGRVDAGLPAEGFVFCSFNAAWKVNAAVLDAWARILAAVPGSVLWMLARGSSDPFIGNLRAQAQARGIDPARLVFAPFRPNPDYLALYRHADLFLDTWPYNAHTTASDALWCGCPVLTWRGETFAGRVAASLLAAVGLPQLVEADVEGYVARAIALAGDPATLAGHRAFLEGPGRASPLFDTAATARALDSAYETMAAQLRSGQRSAFRVGG